MTNAERQARYRARERAKLAELRRSPRRHCAAQPAPSQPRRPTHVLKKLEDEIARLKAKLAAKPGSAPSVRINKRKGIWPKATYMKIWTCLHPDSRLSVSEKKLNKVDTFKTPRHDYARPTITATRRLTRRQSRVEATDAERDAERRHL